MVRCFEGMIVVFTVHVRWVHIEQGPGLVILPEYAFEVAAVNMHAFEARCKNMKKINGVTVSSCLRVACILYSCSPSIGRGRGRFAIKVRTQHIKPARRPL